MAYIQVAQRAVRHTAPAQQSEVQQTYRKWIRNYDGEKQKDEAERTWENLSQQKKWLHWEEVIEVVKSQRDEYESASTGLTQAKESVRYALLLFYSCLPPSRAQEYRTLKFERCRQDDLRPTASTPENKKSNVLFITDEGDRAALYLESFKTSKTRGAQKISLDDLGYFLRHVHRYLTKHRPRLLALQSASNPPQHDYLFVVSE